MSDPKPIGEITAAQAAIAQKHASVLALEHRIEAFGRPALVFVPLSKSAASLAAAKDWDRRNPELAAERKQLLDELVALQKSIDRTEAQWVAADRALRKSQSKLERSGVGPRALEAAVSAKDTEALAVVKSWRAGKECWLCLCGIKGTGKSVAATWLVREVIMAGDTAAFVKASDIAKLSQFEAGAVELEHFKGVHLLVIDDFGAELLTEYAKSQLHELLDHRHEHFGRTIITSNLPWTTTTMNGQTIIGMKERLGERIEDRIAQDGIVEQLTPEKSMRRGKS